LIVDVKPLMNKLAGPENEFDKVWTCF